MVLKTNTDVPSADEGKAGEDTNTATFTVTLSKPPPVPLKVKCKTEDGQGADGATATDRDYADTEETLIFPADGRTTSLDFEVPIYGDSKVELDEKFFVRLSLEDDVTREHAAITHGLGRAIVENDDVVVSIRNATQ